MDQKDVDAEFETQFRLLLESGAVPSDELIRFNELVTSVIDNISSEDKIKVQNVQDKDFEKMAAQIVDRMFKTDLLGDPIQQFKQEYESIVASEPDAEQRKRYAQQLEVVRELESQLKEGGKDRAVSVLEKLEALGDIPAQLVKKFDM